MGRRGRGVGGVVDSGLVVVVCITVFMLGIAVYCLGFVKYEWCHVLFRNNTVRGGGGDERIEILPFICSSRRTLHV